MEQQLLLETRDCAARNQRDAMYRGTGRINVRYLRADDPSDVQQSQFLRAKNVERLKDIFTTEGCHRLDPRNYIAARVSQRETDSLIIASNIAPSDLLNGSLPEINLVEQMKLRVVHGKHRVEAAREHFAPLDAWWPVDLYSDDMDEELRSRLREEYSNSANFSDGEIFRFIRLYHKQGRELEEKKWWARLTRDKSKDLKRILDVKELREGFDNLLEITGLWEVFHIGTMRRYLVLRSHQELATYLLRIRQVWQCITSSNPTVMRLVDAETVRNLELRAPASSEADSSFVRWCFRSASVFSKVQDDTLRREIMEKVCSIERIIPSLSTFCEDTKHLEPCAKAMRLLLEPRVRGTIRTVMQRIFQPSSQGLVPRQETEHRFSDIEVLTAQRFDFCYRQLWLFAMRHFPDLVNIATRKEPTKEKPAVKEPNPVLWYRFARLALKLGFHSQKIVDMGSAEALDIAIRTCLLRVVEYNQNSLDYHVKEIQGRLDTQSGSGDPISPALVAETGELDLQHRCGRPFDDSQRQAASGMFIRWLYGPKKPRGNFITPFFVHRSTFLAFFSDDLAQTEAVEEGVLDAAEDVEETLDKSMLDYSDDRSENRADRKGNDQSRSGSHVDKMSEDQERGILISPTIEAPTWVSPEQTLLDPNLDLIAGTLDTAGPKKDINVPPSPLAPSSEHSEQDPRSPLRLTYLGGYTPPAMPLALMQTTSHDSSVVEEVDTRVDDKSGHQNKLLGNEDWSELAGNQNSPVQDELGANDQVDGSSNLPGIPTEAEQYSRRYELPTTLHHTTNADETTVRSKRVLDLVAEHREDLTIDFISDQYRKSACGSMEVFRSSKKGGEQQTLSENGRKHRLSRDEDVQPVAPEQYYIQKMQGKRQKLRQPLRLADLDKDEL